MKILIIGNSGSGKSWLGKELSSKHDIPVFEMDQIVWEEGGFNKKKSKEDIAKSISKIKSLNLSLAHIFRENFTLNHNFLLPEHGRERNK